MQIRVGVMCCGVNTSKAVGMSLRWGGGGAQFCCCYHTNISKGNFLP